MQKGFIGRRSKPSKGNHLVKAKATKAGQVAADNTVNIEDVDMNDLAQALGT